jgi:hypothetical protein
MGTANAMSNAERGTEALETDGGPFPDESDFRTLRIFQIPKNID